MKKMMFFFSFVLSLFFLASCNNEEVINSFDGGEVDKMENSYSSFIANGLISLYDSNKEIAKEHSAILDFAYKEVKNGVLRKESFSSFNKAVIDEKASIVIKTYAMEKYRKNPIIYREFYSISDNVPSISTYIGSSEYFGYIIPPRRDRIPLPTYLEMFFDHVNRMDPTQIRNSRDLDEKIKDWLYYITVSKRMTSFENEALAMTAAIFFDSYCYWAANALGWASEYNTVFRGFWGDLWADAKDALSVLGTADALAAACVYAEAAIVAAGSGGTLALPAGAAVVGTAAVGSLVGGIYDMTQNPERYFGR